jgi:hypothetical protein
VENQELIHRKRGVEIRQDWHAGRKSARDGLTRTLTEGNLSFFPNLFLPLQQTIINDNHA